MVTSSVSCVGFWFLKIIYSFLSVLGLYCCTRAFSSFSSFELLIAVASLVEDLRLLSAWAWVIVAHGLSCSVDKDFLLIRTWPSWTRTSCSRS